MSVRDLTVLGTASQVPTRYRNHNGYLLRWDGHGFLFDPGEGTQRQMIRSGVTASMINRICVSHFHGDHCLGLSSIVQRISLDRVPHTVHVHYPKSGQVYFERLRHASIFHDVSDLDPQPIATGGTLARHADYTLSAAALDHGVPAFGYRVQAPDKVRMHPEKLAELGLKGKAVGELLRAGAIEVGSRRVELSDVSWVDRGQSFAFVMDTRLCDAAYELAQGVDFLVCESTYLHPEVELAHDHGHMTARQAAELARDCKVGTLLLTHFSQRYPRSEAFEAEAKPYFENSIAARDGMQLPIAAATSPT